MMTVEPRWICWYHAVSTQKDVQYPVSYLDSSLRSAGLNWKQWNHFMCELLFEFFFAQDKRACQASVIEQSRTTIFQIMQSTGSLKIFFSFAKACQFGKHLSSCNRATACLSRSNNPKHIFMHTMEFFEIISFFHESCMRTVNK